MAYVVVGGLLLAIYMASGPRTLPEADSGELAAIAVCGGIAHPPGYPLLSLALQLFARLAPLLGLIPALTLFSMLCSAAAAWLSMLVLSGRGYNPLIAAIATLAIFLCSHVWRAATSFEPFALNLLMAAGVLWTCERVLRSPRGVRNEALGLTALGTLFGLGLCNHHSLVTLIPLALCTLWSPLRALPRRVLMFSCGAVLGALPLLAFLHLRTQTGFVWGDWQELWPRLLQHVLRREYGSFALAAREASGSWTYGPARLLGTLPAALSIAFVLPLCVGIWSLARRMRLACEAQRRLDLGIALSLVTTGLVLPLLFRLKGTDLDNMIADRFFALPAWLLLIPIADGLRELKRAWIWSVVLGLHAVLIWPQAERRTHRFYEDHVRNIFSLLPRNATLVVAADGGFSGGLYGRCVLQRNDVQVVIASLGQTWYLERLAAARRVASAEQTQSPLYLLDIPDAQRRHPPTYPMGPLLCVVTGDARMPSARELFEQNRRTFERLRLPARGAVAALDAWEAEELTNYWRSWHMVGQRLEAEGEGSLASTAFKYRDLFQR